MKFPENFMWGTASAAFQVEGAYLDDGKAPGIWDALHEGHIKHNDNGNVSTDHYHRFREDVAIMKELGMKSYRFSVSWPRVMSAPGVVNEKGLQFYKDLVKELKNAGIEPLITLFHWNLPLWMHEMGGWETEEVIGHFEEYTRVVVEALSDQVQYWLTFNEPQCFVGVGYYYGTHAPFYKRSLEEVKKITRIVMLAHGASARMIRKTAKLAPKIGFAPTTRNYLPLEETPEAIEQARAFSMADEPDPFTTVWWSDPIVLGQAPDQLKSVLSEEDLEKIHVPLDFYAFNVYNADNYDDWTGTTAEEKVNPVPGMPRTAIGWPITPEVLYWAPKFFYERYKLPLLVTENGMANIDFVMLDGKVHDPQRIDFVQRYLKNLGRAIEEGIPVMGYQYWSILDNFEWAEGYDMRFGLVYVDYATGKRTIKDSGYAYAEIIRTNGADL